MIIQIIFISFFGVVGLENYFRRNHPESSKRPSTCLNNVAIKCSSFFTWVGYQVAKFTDIYYFIKEFIGQDCLNILTTFSEIIISPFRTIQGFFEYYTCSFRFPSGNEYGFIFILIFYIASTFVLTYPLIKTKWENYTMNFTDYLNCSSQD